MEDESRLTCEKSESRREGSGLRFCGELGDSGFEFGVGGIGYEAVRLPKDVSVGRGDENVGIVRSGKIDEFFPVGFVVSDGHKMRLFSGGKSFAHAAQDHGAHEGRSRGQHRDLVVSDVWVRGEVCRDTLAPGGAIVATFVREAEDEDQELLAAG